MITFLYCLVILISLSLQKDQNLEKNKQSAMEFFRLAFEGVPQLAVARFVGDTYIQHNPDLEDGTESFIEFFNNLAAQFPDRKLRFFRAIAEGDLVATHSHVVFSEEQQFSAMDFFRFDENGKIVEHWDTFQQIPEESKNDNTMFQ